MHVEYYSFFSDQIGTELLHALEDACSRGVEVRIIYDSMGSRGQRRGFFKRLESLGGRAEVFLIKSGSRPQSAAELSVAP